MSIDLLAKEACDVVLDGLCHQFFEFLCESSGFGNLLQKFVITLKRLTELLFPLMVKECQW